MPGRRNAQKNVSAFIQSLSVRGLRENTIRELVTGGWYTGRYRENGVRIAPWNEHRR